MYATGNHVYKVLGYGGEHLADSVFKLFRMFVNILILQFIIPLNLGLFQYSAPSKHGLMPRFFCINSSAFCLRLFFSCKTGVIERFIGVSADESRTRIGFDGQISAHAALKLLTIRQYSLQALPCLNKNLLRQNCKAHVRCAFRDIFGFL